MIPAILSGKLAREQENMEDILTSNVFGLFRYIKPIEGLIPFLAKMRMQEGDSNPFEFVEETATAKYEFWPWLTAPERFPCEPDVLIRLRINETKKLCLLIEAKLNSGKSSRADDSSAKPYDQLAREWDNLTHIAAQEHAEPLLIYLTADFLYPASEIEASRSEYETKRSEWIHYQPFRCGWLSWRMLADVFQDSRDPIQSDLYDLAVRMGFDSFRGITTIKPIETEPWQFKRPKEIFRWDVVVPTKLQWGFSK